MNSSELWSVIGTIGTLLGSAGTIFFGIKSKKLDKETSNQAERILELTQINYDSRIKKLEWEDILLASTEIAKSLIKDNFLPDIIFAPSYEGGVIAGLIRNNLLNINTYLFTGISIYKDATYTPMDIGDFYKFENDRWLVYIPNAVFSHNASKVLIVDDLVQSGVFMNEMKLLFQNAGYKTSNTRTAAIAVTNVADVAKRKPDYYSLKTYDNNFYFPWGKAR